MEQFEQAVENLAALNENQPTQLTKELLTSFFEEVQRSEDGIKEVRADIKEAFESFASSHCLDLKAVKSGYRFFKDLKKDEKETATVEFIRDRIVDTLLQGAAA